MAGGLYVNKMPRRRSKVTWTANVDVGGTTPMALYRDSPLTQTLDSWAAADQALPGLL
jgi:hypothetical protein